MLHKNMLLAALSLITGLAATAPVVQAADSGQARRQPSAAVDTGRVIVKYRSNASVLSSGRATAQSASGTPAGVQAASQMSARLGIKLSDGRAITTRMQVLKSGSLSSAALAKKLAQDSDVEWAVVDGRRFITSTTAPTDPLYPDNISAAVNSVTAGQWYLRAPTSTYVAAINGPGAWAQSTGSNVVVAVLDTGIRPEHPDLAGKIVAGYDFITDTDVANDGDGRDADPTDPGDWVSDADAATSAFSGCTVESSSWHGTQVAGIIGATSDNGLGMASVAPSVSILPVRVLGKCGGYDSDIIAGMRWAAGLSVSGVSTNTHPAKVLNMSLGSTGTCSPAYQEAVNEVITAGAVVVAAAGNESVAVGAPANCSGVIAVGAVRHAGSKATYSSLGSAVSISAPGGNCGTGLLCAYSILSTTNDGSTTPGSSTYSDASNYAIGTSFASPMVAGTAALMLSMDGNLTPSAVKSLLQSSARAFPSTGGTAGTAVCQAPTGSTKQYECYCTTATCGAGMLDASAALLAVAGQTPPTATFTLSAASVVAGASVTLDGSGSSAQSGASIASYSWTLTSGSSLASFSGSTSGATATLATIAAGTVTVTLTVTDSLGASSSVSQTLTVTASESSSGSGSGSGSGGGGGGGALALWWQCGLLGLGLLLRRRVR